MKKTVFIVFSLISTAFLFAREPKFDESFCNTCDHSNQPWRYYLTADEAPNSLVILPDTPVVGTARFAYDKEQYLWGKSLRATPRGAQAASDAEYSIKNMAKVYSEVLPFRISYEDTPHTYYLMYHIMQDAGQLSTRAAKSHYMRTRPFVFFGEHTCLEADEELLSKDGSYPSGHTTMGYALALVLCEIMPEYQNELLRRAYEYGQSRVICGYHFQSDVDAGRIVGAAAVARLHANKLFLSDLNKAKREIRRKIAKLK